ncbi:MAG TPA: hypothetical protein VHC22_17890 [Pirellulales bacterium]|nr:hypothetical protein [Pirellulales bacterium]
MATNTIDNPTIVPCHTAVRAADGLTFAGELEREPTEAEKLAFAKLVADLPDGDSRDDEAELQRLQKAVEGLEADIAALLAGKSPKDETAETAEKENTMGKATPTKLTRTETLSGYLAVKGNPEKDVRGSDDAITSARDKFKRRFLDGLQKTDGRRGT